VNVTSNTYAALERIAREEGRDLAATIEVALKEFILLKQMTPEQYKQEWDDVLREIRAGVPKDISPEEIEADIDAATREVWAEPRAGGN
jgi:hypothetical protein